MLFKRNVMKTKTGLFPMLSVLCAAAAAVLISIISAGNSDAASVERKNDMKTDKEGHVLVELWKKYNNARLADRPQKESEILDKIINDHINGIIRRFPATGSRGRNHWRGLRQTRSRWAIQ